MKRILWVGCLFLAAAMCLMSLASCLNRKPSAVSAQGIEGNKLTESGEQTDLLTEPIVSGEPKTIEGEPSAHKVSMDNVYYSTSYDAQYEVCPQEPGMVKMDPYGEYYQSDIGNPDYADATFAVEFEVLRFRNGEASRFDEEADEEFRAILDDCGIEYTVIREFNWWNTGLYSYLDAYLIDRLTEAIKGTDFAVGLRGAPEILLTEGPAAYAAVRVWGLAQYQSHIVEYEQMLNH